MIDEVALFESCLKPRYQTGGQLRVPIFVSRRGHRGYGFGSILSGLAKNFLLPTLKSVGRSLGKQALMSAADIAKDVVSKRASPKQAFRSHGKKLLKSSAETLIREAEERLRQRGRGAANKRKRRKPIKNKKVKRRKLANIFDVY